MNNEIRWLARLGIDAGLFTRGHIQSIADELELVRRPFEKIRYALGFGMRHEGGHRLGEVDRRPAPQRHDDIALAGTLAAQQVGHRP